MSTVVVKFGTAVLFKDEGFVKAAPQITQLMKEGIRIVVVSSGSIEAGKERLLELGRKPKQVSDKTLASIGSRVLLNRWSEVLSPFTDVGQIWLTYGNWQDKGEKASIELEIENLLRCSLVPLINENDVVSDAELVQYQLGIGENDRLARMVAELVRADSVLFLTEADGVYEGNTLLQELNAQNVSRIVTWATSQQGRGGMHKKIEEALACAQRGMRVAIAGLTEDSIVRFVHGEHVDTMVV